MYLVLRGPSAAAGRQLDAEVDAPACDACDDDPTLTARIVAKYSVHRSLWRGSDTYARHYVPLRGASLRPFEEVGAVAHAGSARLPSPDDERPAGLSAPAWETRVFVLGDRELRQSHVTEVRLVCLPRPPSDGAPEPGEADDGLPARALVGDVSLYSIRTLRDCRMAVQNLRITQLVWTAAAGAGTDAVLVSFSLTWNSAPLDPYTARPEYTRS